MRTLVQVGVGYAKAESLVGGRENFIFTPVKHIT